MPPGMSSLCFNDALVQRRVNKITEDEFIQSIAVHCTGSRHGTNGLCNNDTVMNEDDYISFACNIQADPFTSAMASWVFSVFKKPVKGGPLTCEFNTRSMC